MVPVVVVSITLNRVAGTSTQCSADYRTFSSAGKRAHHCPTRASYQGASRPAMVVVVSMMMPSRKGKPA